jgi:hypothetical protein
LVATFVATPSLVLNLLTTENPTTKLLAEGLPQLA